MEKLVEQGGSTPGARVKPGGIRAPEENKIIRARVGRGQKRTLLEKGRGGQKPWG